jgi:hypothetical protein
MNIFLLSVPKRKHVTGGHVALMEHGRKVYNVLVRKPERKETIRKTKAWKGEWNQWILGRLSGGVN